MFNALRYIKSLEGVGFPREQAEAQVQLVIDSFQDNIATKTDMAQLRTEMAELRTELKSEMAELRVELKTEMSDLRGELRAEIAAININMNSMNNKLLELKSDLIFKLGGLIVICTGVLGLLMKA